MPAAEAGLAKEFLDRAADCRRQRYQRNQVARGGVRIGKPSFLPFMSSSLVTPDFLLATMME